MTKRSKVIATSPNLSIPRCGAHLSASSIGSRFRSAVSLGSLNHDLIGIALSKKAHTQRETHTHTHTQ